MVISGRVFKLMYVLLNHFRFFVNTFFVVDFCLFLFWVCLCGFLLLLLLWWVFFLTNEWSFSVQLRHFINPRSKQTMFGSHRFLFIYLLSSCFGFRFQVDAYQQTLGVLQLLTSIF